MKPLFDDLTQVSKGPAHDKKDVLRVDDPLFFFAGAPIMLYGLNLGDRIMGDLQIHVRLLHAVSYTHLTLPTKRIV